MKTTIDQLSEALENTRGKTPLEVVDSFCPRGTKIGGHPLVELKAGHDLFFQRIKHPLAGNHLQDWTATDVAVALFAFTRTSKELFRAINEDTLEDELHEFLDDIPLGAIEAAGADLIAHWIRSRATAVPMTNPHATGSKKKRVSDGGLRP